MRGRRLGDPVSENAPHPHFVSPSPRKKTRGEGLSTGKMLSLRLCRAVFRRARAVFRHVTLRTSGRVLRVALDAVELFDAGFHVGHDFVGRELGGWVVVNFVAGLLDPGG